MESHHRTPDGKLRARGLGIQFDGEPGEHCAITDVVEATEEAIIDAMVANETMTGRDGVTVMALPHDWLMELYDAHRGPRAS